MAGLYAGEPVPFEKSADYDEAETIREEVEALVKDTDMAGLIPEQAVAFAALGMYLAKAGKTPKGKARTATILGWMKGRVEWLAGKVFKRRRPAHA